MFQRCATALRFERCSVLCYAAVLVACGTATGPVPNEAEPHGEAGAPSEANDLDSTSGGTGGSVSPTQSSSSKASGGGGFAAVGSTNVTAATVSASATGGSNDPVRCGIDPHCVGESDDPRCMGDVAVHCELDEETGCVVSVAEECAAGACSDGECQSAASGETCTAPIAVGESYVLGGDDFAAEFGGDLELAAHAGCAFGDTGASDAVLSIELEANDQLVVMQKGELEAVFALLRSCSAEGESCVKSEYGGLGTTLTHTAEAKETLLLVVDAVLVEPTTPSYEIWINVNPECGNGILEAPEECDDENLLEGDGCSPSCSVEFLWACDGASPSECALLPSLGSVSAGEPISAIPFGDYFGVDDSLYYRVTFQERVLVDLVAKTRTQNTGDVDVYFYDDWNSLANHSNISGDDVTAGIPFEPGTYLVEIRAKTDLPEGFDVELTARSPGICGDNEVSPFEECDNGGELGCEDCTVALEYACDFASPSTCYVVDAWQHAFGEPFTVAANPGTRIHWLVDFTEDVVLSGNITSAGDPFSEYAEYMAVWASTGMIDSRYVDFDGTLPLWSLAPGRYKLQFLTPTGFPAGYTLTLTLATP